MADGPKAEDFKPDGPVRQPFMFDMMKGDDAGAGFPMLQLPPKEEPAPTPRVKKARSPSAPHRFLRLRIQKPTRNFLLAVFAFQAIVVGVNLALPRIAAVPASLNLPLAVLVAVAGLASLVGVVATGTMLARRGLRGAAKAAVLTVLAAALVGGTAFLMIPTKDWKRVPSDALRLIEKGWAELKTQGGHP